MAGCTRSGAQPELLQKLYTWVHVVVVVVVVVDDDVISPSSNTSMGV